MTALLSAFGLVFVAELGDKSMLLAITLAARYRWWWVLAALTIQAAVLFAVAVLLGGAADALLPDRVIGVGSGLLFIGFGIWTLRADDEEEAVRAVDGRSAVLVIAVLALALGLSELGDKTQLAALSLSGMNPAERLGVWTGATAGLVAADALAILAGQRLLRVVPRWVITRAAGALFIASGIGVIVLALR